MIYSSDITVWTNELVSATKVTVNEHSVSISNDGWEVSIFKQGPTKDKGMDVAKMLRDKLEVAIARVQDEARAQLEELANWHGSGGGPSGWAQ